MELLNKFYYVLNAFEMKNIELPLFYNSKVGIRFDIGDSIDSDSLNDKYINDCYERANKILDSLDYQPDILALKLYFDKQSSLEKDIKRIIELVGLTLPQVVDKKETEEKNNIAILLWDLSKTSISKEKLLKEILKSEIGGESLLSSSVFWICCESNIIFHSDVPSIKKLNFLWKFF